MLPLNVYSWSPVMLMCSSFCLIREYYPAMNIHVYKIQERTVIKIYYMFIWIYYWKDKEISLDLKIDNQDLIVLSLFFVINKILLWWGLLDTTLCDKVCYWLEANQQLILLKLALNTKNPNKCSPIS